MDSLFEKTSVYDEQKRSLSNGGSAVLDVFIIDRIVLVDDLDNYSLMVG